MKSIINAVGLLLVITTIYQLLKSLVQFIIERTDTTLFSTEAVQLLQSNKVRTKLNLSINHYHTTGVWKNTNFELWMQPY